MTRAHIEQLGRSQDGGDNEGYSAVVPNDTLDGASRQRRFIEDAHTVHAATPTNSLLMGVNAFTPCSIDDCTPLVPTASNQSRPSRLVRFLTAMIESTSISINEPRRALWRLSKVVSIEIITWSSPGNPLCISQPLACTSHRRARRAAVTIEGSATFMNPRTSRR